MKRRILIVFLCICIFQVSGKKISTDTVKNLQDDTNKVNAFFELADRQEEIGVYDSCLLNIKNGEALAEKIGFKKGIAQALNGIGLFYMYKGDYAMGLKYQLRSLYINQQIGNKEGIAHVLIDIGNCYWYPGNYPKSLEYYFEALNVAQGIKSDDYISLALGGIGNVYEEQTNYPEALKYFLKALSIYQETDSKRMIAISFANIGNNYEEQGKYPEALEYYFKALNIAQEFGDKGGIVVNLCGIANIYVKENKHEGNRDKPTSELNNRNSYSEALDYNAKALNIAQEIGDTRDIAAIYLNLGQIDINLKKYKQAKALLDSTFAILKNVGDKKFIKEAYNYLAIVDSSLGNYKAFNEDYKQYIIYRDSLINQESVKKITQLELSREFAMVEDSMKIEQEKMAAVKTAEIKRTRFFSNSIIAILLLAVLLTIVLINRQRSQLAQAKMTLNEYIKTMLEKNTLLEQYKTDLDELKSTKATEIEDNRVERLQELNQASILTEEDWDKFKILFEQVYKGFFSRLQKKMPDLTPAEIRLICLTKLKLGTKHMASVLGVSFDTIKKTRYRLRKRQGLSGEDDIEDIVESI